MCVMRTFKIYSFRTSGQDGGIGKHDLSPYTTTAKITTRLQNKYHPESSENRVVWKSNNQGIKEVMFIQTGRRGRERHGEVQRDVDTWNGQSHTHVQWINIGRDTLGVRDTSPRPYHPTQGSSTKKVSPYNFWL